MEDTRRKTIELKGSNEMMLIAITAVITVVVAVASAITSAEEKENMKKVVHRLRIMIRKQG